MPVWFSPQVISATSSGATSGGRDRKSTRLNSSHSQISYAVFCLKKKKILNEPPAWPLPPLVLPRPAAPALPVYLLTSLACASWSLLSVSTTLASPRHIQALHVRS